jgi:hypothetical protein
MADPGPPSIAVESASDIPRDGTLQREVKKSLESLLSRSDSGASGDEVDEPEQTLSVPSTVQGKPRETSRKGRKISVNEALKDMETIKEGYLDQSGRFQVYRITLNFPTLTL